MQEFVRYCVSDRFTPLYRCSRGEMEQALAKMAERVWVNSALLPIINYDAFAMDYLGVPTPNFFPAPRAGTAKAWIAPLSPDFDPRQYDAVMEEFLLFLKRLAQLYPQDRITENLTGEFALIYEWGTHNQAKRPMATVLLIGSLRGYPGTWGLNGRSRFRGLGKWK